MKRAGMLFEEIIARENLRLGLCKALRGKRYRSEARQFTADAERNLRLMAEQVGVGRFPLGRYRQFVIHDPKRRTITAPCFAERVLHHAIMNVCEPVFERRLIRDSYACRVGRGRVAAVERAQRMAGKFGFFLKMDVRSYFASISHEVLIRGLERLFKDDRLLELLEQIIRSFQVSPGRGLPIGSLTSQHFANFYLGRFDRFVKEGLCINPYLRYMDDMLLFGHASSELDAILVRCRAFLGQSLQLQLKPVPYINRTSHGVDFLGCRVFPDRVILNRRSRVRFQRKMFRLEEQYLRGELDEQELQERATSLVAFTRAASARSWHFRQSVLERLPVSGRRPPTG